MKKEVSGYGLAVGTGLCTRHRNLILLIFISALCTLTYMIIPQEKYGEYLTMPTNFDAFRINPKFLHPYLHPKLSLFSALNGEKEKEEKKTEIVVATVACGKSEYLPTLLKSSVLFTLDEKTALHFIIFTDPDNIHNLNKTMEAFVTDAQSHGFAQNFSYEIQPTWFPSPEKTGINWREMYANCSTERLFFPSVLPKVDSVIYLDADTIIFGNLSQVWLEFSKMDSEQMIALGPDNMWTYNSGRKVPYVGDIGVNAGVTLMNLTRLRQFQFEEKVDKEYKIYRRWIDFADQDVINIIFHDNPTKIKVLPCSFNLIWSRCNPDQPCDDIQNQGVLILHGAGGGFKYKHDYPNSVFPMIYEKMKSFQLAESPLTVLEEIKEECNSRNLFCSSASPDILVRNAMNYFKAHVDRFPHTHKSNSSDLVI